MGRFQCGVGGGPGATRGAGQRARVQTKTETSLEAKVTKQKPSDGRDIVRRQSSLEETAEERWPQEAEDQGGAGGTQKKP